ncbi:glutathione S-transferase family protein [Actinoplanes sp. RD1]|uniref:hypothetical protein n=1 Tax=Actinoplanes sp. RD1 TaxID=3064538 RepID=UPI002742345B|nr:hypothetical protein [Actinoplanes sp. RD1]
MVDTQLPSTAGTLTRIDDRNWTVDGAAPLELHLPAGPVFVLDKGVNGRYVLPSDATSRPLTGRGRCWVLPESPSATEPAWAITADADLSVRFGDDGCHVTVRAGRATLTSHRARPHADVDGAGFTLGFPGGPELADALAGFYWGTILPSVIERTAAADYPDPDGYVISTLADKYVGTYPDVDHEFQIKGRLAWGSATDLDVVRRMIELQLRLMREDPQQLWRDPCAVQPDGEREYHVRRSSQDGTQNAVMFLVTGNVEVIESVWLYLARTRDLGWLREHIADLEGAASCVEACMDPLGRLWSDVYYEDQVIKDGRETLAAALALRSFELLAELEKLLDRPGRAAHYTSRATALAGALAQPLPTGYWDPGNNRFVDWVDRSGVVHDHIHLLANVLPVMFGAAGAEQARHAVALVDRELDEFQRFPTFLAARIADYTPAEIGDGGPYDLCAAGRYWCWDAAFWSWRGNGAMLLDQLHKVARQGAADDWVMGERYDMSHVYYTDGSNWHGAAHYYEYPNVFAWVLIHEYLGVRPSLTADLRIAPRLTGPGSVTLAQEAYQLSYELGPDGFTLHNLAPVARTFELALAAAERTVELAPGASVTVRPTDES